MGMSVFVDPKFPNLIFDHALESKIAKSLTQVGHRMKRRLGFKLAGQTRMARD
jgi:hypothetical protein